MKGLTLTQPYATLVAIGAKKIETRSWSPSYRGPLAIHAGAGLGPVGGKLAFVDLCLTEPFHDALLAAGVRRATTLPFGAVVAVVDLVDCCPIVLPKLLGDGAKKGEYLEIGQRGYTQRHEVRGAELAFGDYTPGRSAWLLAEIRALPQPIPCRGALGLWTVPADVEAAIGALHG